jgi:hypothetical protein
MKKLFLLLILVATPVKADQFRLTDYDKLLHISAGFIGTYAGSHVLQRFGVPKAPAIIISSVLTYSALLAKEQFVDKEFDKNDVKANTIGVAAGVLFAIPF